MDKFDEEITWYDHKYEKIKYDEEKEKYGKNGHDEQFDKKKMMMKGEIY
jgi:hypothetical protein